MITIHLGDLQNAIDIVKKIHEGYDLSNPSVLLVSASGSKCCIGYNYGKASQYGAYIFFNVFDEVRFIVCNKGVWHNYAIQKIES